MRYYIPVNIIDVGVHQTFVIRDINNSYIVRVFSSSTRNFIGLLVYWSIGSIYSRRAVYYSPVHARLGGAKLYFIVYHVLSWSARGAHLRPMHLPKLAPHAMCASAQDAYIGIGQSCINKLMDFPFL